MNPAWYTSSVATGRVSIENETGNQYISFMTWGSPESDPNTGDGYVKVKNAGGTQIASGVNKDSLTNVAKISIDYRFDKMDVIDPETGALSQTLLMRTTDEIRATDPYFGGDCNILTNQYWWDDDDDYNLNKTTTNERTGFTYWYLNVATGKPTFRAYNADGTAKTITVDNFNEGWNNYSVIVDIPGDTVYGYINDIYVGSGHLAGVGYASTHEKAGQRKHVTAKTGTWPYTYNLRPTDKDHVVCYSSFDNFLVDTYANGFASTEPTIEATNKIAETTLPAGTKTQISVVAANIPAGGTVAAFVNGVKTNLVATGNTYNCNIPLAAGYTSIYLAMVDADGEIVKDSEGTEIKSAEWTYYAFGFNGERTLRVELDCEDGMQETNANVPVNTGMNQNYMNSAFGTSGVVGPIKGTVVADGENHYIKNVNWGTAATDPNSGEGYVKVSDGRNQGYISGYSNNDSILVVSADYRVEKFQKVDSSTGTATDIPVTSQSFYDNRSYMPSEYFMSVNVMWDDDGNGTFESEDRFQNQHTFAYHVNGKVAASYYDENGVLQHNELDIDPGVWHNYKVIYDAVSDRMWSYVDGELVASGYIYGNGTTYADVASFKYPGVYAMRTYNTKDFRVVTNIDNFYAYSYGGAMDAPTDAIVNAAITAEGAALGIVPANLGLAEDEEITIAVIARAASGAIEMQKYEDVTAESSYKAFGFEMADIDKVFVWNWDTLAPIVEAIENP